MVWLLDVWALSMCVFIVGLWAVKHVADLYCSQTGNNLKTIWSRCKGKGNTKNTSKSVLSARLHRNSLLLLCLLTFTLCLTQHNAQRHRRSRTHVHFRSSSHRGKPRFENILPLFVVWPLVVNNDMTHPVVSMSMIEADRHVQCPATCPPTPTHT